MIILKILLAALGLLALLLLIALVRTLTGPKKEAAYAPKTDPDRAMEYAKKLSAMVQVETVSRSGDHDPEKFRKLHKVMRDLFPAVFETCEVNDIEGNLLVRWPGKSSEKPVLFLAHMDVVEANPGDWTYPPFSGKIEDGKVWGRGSGDTKCSLMAGFQAVEESIKAGIVPDQDVWLASSCTEEVGGQGAPKLVDWLQSRGIRLALLCDEGGAISEEPVAGIKGYYAMVGEYEKGFGDFKFTAHGKGGHSSAPPKGTPIPTLAKFVAAAEKHSPLTVKFTPEVEETFKAIAPYCGFGYRYVLTNLWLFKPVLKKFLAGSTAGAMLGTTIAFTMQQGSQGSNVIPQEASVIANLRFAPFENGEQSAAKMKAFAEKYGVSMKVLRSRDATKPVDLTGAGFKLVKEAEKAVFKDIPLVPYVVTGGTDARNFEAVSDTVIRFSPVVYDLDCMGRMHGIDEYIGIECLPNAVDYYKYIIANNGKLAE